MPHAHMRLALAAAAFAATIASPTANAQEPPIHEVQVVAKKYAFEPADIEVSAGERVRLTVRSADSVHGFAIERLKIDVRIPQGSEAVTIEFTAPPPGRYEIACSEFCGSGHGHMNAALVSSAAPRLTKGRT